jgi:hypothetical protein
MFSYRHAFHAGNHADVLKHLTLVALLKYLTDKDAELSQGEPSLKRTQRRLLRI